MFLRLVPPKRNADRTCESVGMDNLSMLPNGNLAIMGTLCPKHLS